MPEARNGDVRIYYEIAGDDGPWILMIMGLGYGAWGWEPLVPLLADGNRVITFDNRGIRHSDHPPGPYNTKVMAEDARAVLDAAEVPSAHVIGTSLGGYIAQELAFAHPDRVDKLVLACTARHGVNPYPTPPVTVDLLARAAGMDPDTRLRRFVENAFSRDFVETRPEIIEHVLELRKTTNQPFEAWQAQSAAGATFDPGERLASIKAPTLVMTGDQDNVVDSRNSNALADAIPDARVVQMRGGHLFFWENPERFVGEVRRFLAA